MTDQNKLRNLEDLGEFALIDHLTEGFENRNPTTVYGVGDDAAVIAITEDE